ncbi:hypothetical protein GZL_02726 [Streptomyces sp. 769]|uniref:Uncharacterized protein n=1 Tax=Streptomyces yunnanensis TaxID=156453 RepID=A0A9X8QZG3_9ACTN|nr:hypothetical protein GZL_02726 [Streptomyces sp. 769]ANZ15654.1 hypothetical protein SNOUR_11700 [Streptomyces noursei ATCC 11455]SHN22792.1 hypothetical protein SAMN05216268_12589 [Streptomyces yunnanensis]
MSERSVGIGPAEGRDGIEQGCAPRRCGVGRSEVSA